MTGYLWLLRRYGPRRTYRYWLARRRGITIDYAQIFTSHELARLGEHFDPAPWES